jgi:hypothetical protein
MMFAILFPKYAIFLSKYWDHKHTTMLVTNWLQNNKIAWVRKWGSNYPKSGSGFCIYKVAD